MRYHSKFHATEYCYCHLWRNSENLFKDLLQTLYNARSHFSHITVITVEIQLLNYHKEVQKLLQLQEKHRGTEIVITTSTPISLFTWHHLDRLTLSWDGVCTKIFTTILSKFQSFTLSEKVITQVKETCHKISLIWEIKTSNSCTNYLFTPRLKSSNSPTIPPKISRYFVQDNNNFLQIIQTGEIPLCQRESRCREFVHSIGAPPGDKPPRNSTAGINVHRILLRRH